MGGNKRGHGRNGPEANLVVQVLWPRGGSSSDLKKKRMNLRTVLKVESVRPDGLEVWETKMRADFGDSSSPG